MEAFSNVVNQGKYAPFTAISHSIAPIFSLLVLVSPTMRLSPLFLTQLRISIHYLLLYSQVDLWVSTKWMLFSLCRWRSDISTHKFCDIGCIYHNNWHVTMSICHLSYHSYLSTCFDRLIYLSIMFIHSYTFFFFYNIIDQVDVK